MQFRYQPPYLNKNLNTWFEGTVNARYISKTVCLSFFCKFIKFAHTIQWGFLQKFLFGHFYVFPELFCLLQHILATVQPKIHLNTKFEILPFGWTKCPKTEPFFLKLPYSCSLLHTFCMKNNPTYMRFLKISYPFRPILHEFNTLFTLYSHTVLDCKKKTLL